MTFPITCKSNHFFCCPRNLIQKKLSFCYKLSIGKRERYRSAPRRHLWPRVLGNFCSLMIAVGIKFRIICLGGKKNFLITERRWGVFARKLAKKMGQVCLCQKTEEDWAENTALWEIMRPNAPAMKYLLQGTVKFMSRKQCLWGFSKEKSTQPSIFGSTFYHRKKFLKTERVAILFYLSLVTNKSNTQFRMKREWRYSKIIAEKKKNNTYLHLTYKH